VLNDELTRYADEQQVCRIDHYLGKETVQNILMFRFSNSIFEQLWNRNSIDHVQITVSEKLGVGARGGYYEEAGALRDMVQNHMLQVLALTAMEPPVSLESECIRDEKVKLLKSIRPLTRRTWPGRWCAGNTSPARSRPAGAGLPAGTEGQADSNVETYVALKLFIDNWRWSGVPFFCARANICRKAPARRASNSGPRPMSFSPRNAGRALMPTRWLCGCSRNEGIYLRFNGKVPGMNVSVRPVRMNFSYNAEYGAYTPEAYERLLLDALVGDSTLFIRRDEVEAAWQYRGFHPRRMDGKPLTNREFCAPGTWGPVASDEMLAQSGHVWHEPRIEFD
jgi:glucose-6-phosphate 1-dehydrogenase